MKKELDLLGPNGYERVVFERRPQYDGRAVAHFETEGIAEDWMRRFNQAGKVFVIAQDLIDHDLQSKIRRIVVDEIQTLLTETNLHKIAAKVDVRKRQIAAERETAERIRQAENTELAPILVDTVEDTQIVDG